ncbi:50S ribosomal protein L23 [Thecamonas trahens ATCC 50062]|uniref:Large ribosomal subunit protein uL23m n=1 Tax=Thecamonas trahens ATCC 50062 TaxID=461836 RepID=A0A0L0D7H3_THETB|nr:50S ribosomal protein L23 [Thecamonas trahens ATCC 50062]KNC48304.1 50S ribosomal protein L23 [Thecamonas trahens ATCC 50062]|eukprot:XP_013758871.1 50S ribosomal protein L23 [Thecamonas trahens ATCC 50062]
MASRLVRFPSMTIRLMQSTKRLPKDTLAFKVPRKVGKFEIKAYMEALYGVRVASVNTAIYPGKTGVSRDGRYKRSDWKRAFVKFAGFSADSPVTSPASP